MPAPDPQIEQWTALASEVGLVLRALIPAQRLPEEVMSGLDQWLEDGCHGGMEYLANARSVMADPRDWKDWTRCVALFALPYHRPADGFRDGGRVARYAVGRDYHNLLGKKLERLGKRLRAAGMVQRFRACTDAAPLLEREYAFLGGVGWRGKNTLVLDPADGPWVILGELLVDAEFPTYLPREVSDPGDQSQASDTGDADANTSPPKDHGRRWASCGSCTACLDVCPTGALTGEYQLDARLCLSYLTIEHRGAIPEELRPKIGEWVFGCDLCSEVCPFGHQASDHSQAWGRKDALTDFRLEDLLSLDEDEFRTAFAGSPIRRAGLQGLKRNACVVLGNLRRSASTGAQATDVNLTVPPPQSGGGKTAPRGERELRALLEAETDPLVCEHAQWALDQGRNSSPQRKSST
jgi:epoxyqueuosine reductase